MHRVFVLLFFILCFTCAAYAQKIDVLHYDYRVTLSDKSDEILGEAHFTIRFTEFTTDFSLDLVSAESKKGMTVTRVSGSVRVNGFEHKNDRLLIRLGWPALKNDTLTFYINYKGIPKDGLIISKNKYGERTFFADNWPDRARHWIPCNDRPDDKATVDFYVALPKHYQVVSNGRLEIDSVNGGLTGAVDRDGNYFHWKETVPIPTKVMVIGAARFAVKEFEEKPGGVPVSAWVYPQDSAKGFFDYALAVPVLKFYQEYIGEYPFQKLANVQSKTIFGGMENAGCIFYSESSITGTRSAEALIAHEIVHQWFGNSATEKHFAHLWLSEGFATHLTNVYLEHKYGKDTVLKRLKDDRETIIGFLKRKPLPVVDSTSSLMALLNANSYQKGGWILRMIQAEVGDSIFQQIIRTYYDAYKFRNAETRDFQKVVEDVTGKSWQRFFDQWLFKPGIPKLEVIWKQKGNSVEIRIEHKGNLYELPIEFEIRMEDGQTFYKREFMKNKQMIINAFVEGKVKQFIFDPQVKLLADFLVFIEF